MNENNIVLLLYIVKNNNLKMCFDTTQMYLCLK